MAVILTPSIDPKKVGVNCPIENRSGEIPTICSRPLIVTENSPHAMSPMPEPCRLGWALIGVSNFLATDKTATLFPSPKTASPKPRTIAAPDNVLLGSTFVNAPPWPTKKVSSPDPPSKNPPPIPDEIISLPEPPYTRFTPLPG